MRTGTLSAPVLPLLLAAVAVACSTEVSPPSPSAARAATPPGTHRAPAADSAVPTAPDLAIPRRIVSLAPGLTETLFALGVGSSVVGVTRYCDVPPEVARLPKVGGFLDPSVEAILALRPDLVVAVPSPTNRDPVLALRSFGVRVEVFDDTTLEALAGLFRRLGRIVGRAGAGEELARRLEDGLRALAARVAGLPRPRTLMLLGRRPPVVAGPGSLADGLLRVAGGENVVGPGGGPYPVFSMERLLAARAEMVLDLSAMDGARAGEPGDDGEWWHGFPGVGTPRVLRLDATLLLRPGPRTLATAEALAEALHPGLGGEGGEGDAAAGGDP